MRRDHIAGTDGTAREAGAARVVASDRTVLEGGEVRLNDVLAIGSAEEFDRAALAVFRRQARECAPYAEYLSLVGIAPDEVTRFEQIPYLPIELFKSHRVYCGAAEPETVFTSSSTGGQGESRHHVAHVADYERIYTRGFELFYGPVAGWSIFALLPSYLERTGSSLVRMADGLISRGHTAGRGGGFYLHDFDRLLADIEAVNGPRILLGVSYALLDLAELVASRGGRLPEGTVVMETGGMKGRREEISKAEMHRILRTSFGVNDIHSEYGMAELMSQAYSSGGGAGTVVAGRSGDMYGGGSAAGGMNEAETAVNAAVFHTPPWMRVSVRNLADPFDVRREGRGGIDVADLGNLFSCAFIQTQDVGRYLAGGGFTLEGRVERSDIRGCNLLVQ